MNRYPEVWNEKNFKYLSVNELRYQKSYFQNYKSDISELEDAAHKGFYSIVLFFVGAIILIGTYSYLESLSSLI